MHFSIFNDYSRSLRIYVMLKSSSSFTFVLAISLANIFCIFIDPPVFNPFILLQTTVENMFKRNYFEADDAHSSIACFSLPFLLCVDSLADEMFRFSKITELTLAFSKSAERAKINAAMCLRAANLDQAHYHNCLSLHMVSWFVPKIYLPI